MQVNKSKQKGAENRSVTMPSHEVSENTLFHCNITHIFSGDMVQGDISLIILSNFIIGNSNGNIKLKINIIIIW